MANFDIHIEIRNLTNVGASCRRRYKNERSLNKFFRYLRKIQQEGHLCAAKCYDNRNAKRDELDRCEENCSKKYYDVTGKIYEEFSTWQVGFFFRFFPFFVMNPLGTT